MVLEEFAMEFDLNRIKSLAIWEKYKLLNHVKLIYTEALGASKNGIKSLEKSENYTSNKTYNLFALLLVDDVSYESINEIVRNYAQLFEKSDTYYAQTIILGTGVMMIQKEFPPDAILSFLINLLGTEFLNENLKYSGHMTPEEGAKFEFDSEIEYKPFEGNLRRVKYNLLGLLKLRDTQGLDAVRVVVNGNHSDNKFRQYFNMMDVTAPEVTDYLFEDFKDVAVTEDRLKVYGAYALLKGQDVFSTHYMFNSVIGKYSRFDKDSGEIEQELSLQLAEILMKAGQK